MIETAAKIVNTNERDEMKMTTAAQTRATIYQIMSVSNNERKFTS